jgi:hypothetical protein
LNFIIASAFTKIKVARSGMLPVKGYRKKVCGISYGMIEWIEESRGVHGIP